MKYNTITLRNGLRIIHLPSSSPVIYCGYEVNAGTRNETLDEVGIAHFCEHLTFKGTSRRRSYNINNCLESVGGDLNAYTTKEDTVYYAAILKEHFARAVDLLTDIVFHSIYPQHEMEKEVEVVCDEIQSYKDSPDELIYDDFENIIFKGHPLGHNILGEAEKLRTYTTVHAHHFTERYYRPENSIFFINGDVPFKRIVRLVEKSTADFGSSFPILNKLQTIELPEYKPQTVEIDKHTHQAHVMIGTRAYDIRDPKRIALYLMNNILGGPGMNARFNESLRERHGLVYTVESTMISYSDTGVWCTYFGSDPKDVKKCLRLVRRELDRMMDKPMTDSQLRAAKKQIKGQIGVACDNSESFALDFGKSFLHYGWEKDITSLFNRIDELTPELMQQVACEIFNPEQITTLIYS